MNTDETPVPAEVGDGRGNLWLRPKAALSRVPLFTVLSVILAGTLIGGSDDKTISGSGIQIRFSWADQLALGQDLVWRLSVTNSSRTERRCRVAVDANAVERGNGAIVADVTGSTTTNVLAAGAGATLVVSVPPVRYAEWTSQADMFEMRAFVAVEGVEETWMGRARTTVARTQKVPRQDLQDGQSDGSQNPVNPVK